MFVKQDNLNKHLVQEFSVSEHFCACFPCCGADQCLDIHLFWCPPLVFMEQRAEKHWMCAFLSLHTSSFAGVQDPTAKGVWITNQQSVKISSLLPPSNAGGSATAIVSYCCRSKQPVMLEVETKDVCPHRSRTFHIMYTSYTFILFSLFFYWSYSTVVYSEINCTGTGTLKKKGG